MLTFISDIICGGHKESYDFLIEWIANMAKGNKNASTPVLKGPMGLGKSTLPQFLSKYVLGLLLCLESGSGPLKSHFNDILGGKLFVCFEELENSSVAEWNSMSSVLKRMITSDRIVLEAKNKNPIECDNINNYMILSNNDAVKDDEGRRYFVLDLDAKKIGDSVFFDNLYSQCFNDQIGEAFYCYLLEIDTKGFKAQGFPITRNKLDSISKRLDSVYQFLKDDYILCNKGIQCSVQDLYDGYMEHSKLNVKRQYTKIDFNKQMKLINIVHYPSSGINKYKISKDDLLLIAKKYNWIHELDEFVAIIGEDDELDEHKYKTLYEKLLIEHKALKKVVNKLNLDI
jgi:hypothetical protein